MYVASCVKEHKPSSASSRTSAQSYPMAKSVRWSSFTSSGGCFAKSADTRVDFPDDDSPRRRICLEGIDREDDTESKIDDQRSCGGASGEDDRELSMAGVGGGGRTEA